MTTPLRENEDGTGAREAGPASSLQMTDHLHVVAGVSTLSLGGGEARSLSQLPDGALQYPVPGPMGPNAPGPGRGAWARGLGPCVRARVRGPGRLHLGSHCWKYTFLYVKLQPVQ